MFNTKFKRAALGAVTAAVIAMPALLAGCAIGNSALDNETQETLEQKLIRGKTTKDQIISQLGQPGQRGASASGQEYWVYSLGKIGGKVFIPFAPLITGSNGGGTKTLTIYFTGNVVQNFLYSETRD
jgi:outer membrane protein assembly factor BamE (lipoprotein component of BamABCDE complex)